MSPASKEEWWGGPATQQNVTPPSGGLISVSWTRPGSAPEQHALHRCTEIPVRAAKAFCTSECSLHTQLYTHTTLTTTDIKLGRNTTTRRCRICLEADRNRCQAPLRCVFLTSLSNRLSPSRARRSLLRTPKYTLTFPTP
jgi:hypothetical protein